MKHALLGALILSLLPTMAFAGGRHGGGSRSNWGFTFGFSSGGPGYGYGGPWRYGYAGGFSTTQINYNEYIEGTLFVNIVDKSVEKIVWQGRATKTLDENADADKRESNINAAVKQIFTKYPPAKK